MSNALLQKVLTLVLTTATGPEVFFATTTTFISNYYDALEETLNNMKILKIHSYPGENVTDCCTEIFIDDENLKSTGTFKPDHLGYITRIFEDTSYSRFSLWEIHNYKEVI